MKNNKPNLFIVGAPKCGTTFLTEQLSKYNEIFFSSAKEINFFSYENLVNDSSYNDYKIGTEKLYLNHFKHATEEKYLADGSVSYFAYSDVPSKIREFNPDAKIIIMLRNPIKRAFSHYLMDVRMGYAEGEINTLLTENKNKKHFHHQYINNSLYFKNISNYLASFDQNQVLIILLEEMENQVDKILKFLELKENLFDFDEKVNENKTPKNFISKYFQKNRNIATKLKLIIPKKVIKIFSNKLYKKAETIELNKDTEKVISNYLEQDLIQLSQLMNRDLLELWKIKF